MRLFAATLAALVAVGAGINARPSQVPVRAALQTSHVTHAVTVGHKKKKVQPNSIKHPVPLGRTASIGGWKVKVVSLAPFVPGEFETRPSAGYHFLVYVLQDTRIAKTADSPVDSLTEVLVRSTKDQRSVDTNPMCSGGSPYLNKVDQGGIVQDGACISVPVNDTHLVLGVSAAFSFSNRTAWFATS